MINITYFDQMINRPTLVDVARDDFLGYMSTGTRGHAFKLYKPSANSSRSCFFASRDINIWNSLPQSTDFSSINAFRRQYVVLIFLSS